MAREKDRSYPRLEWRDGIAYMRYSRTTRTSLKTDDKVLANLLFEEKKRQYIDGKVAQLDKGQRIRLKEFEAEYLAYREEKVLRGDISENTLNNDRRSFKVLLEILGDIPLRALTRKKAQGFTSRLFDLRMAKKKARDHDTIASVRNGVNSWTAPFGMAFKYAVKRGYMDANPFTRDRDEEYNATFSKGKRMPKDLTEGDINAMVGRQVDKIAALEERLRVEDLTKGQRWQMEDSLNKEGQFLRMYLTYVMTGLRRSELVRMELRHIDLDSGRIIIEVQKNGDSSVFNLNEDMARVIRSQILHLVPNYEQMDDRMRASVGRKFLFPRWRNPDTVTNLFSALRSEAGVEDKKTLHGLRHSFGHLSVRRGVHPRALQQMMRHKSYASTQIYTEMRNEELRQETEKLKFGGYADIEV